MFILVSHAQSIMCWGGEGEKGNVSVLFNFFGALGNCKIIDILQWWGFRFCFIIHSLLFIHWVRLYSRWSAEPRKCHCHSNFLLKSLIFRRVQGGQGEGGILSQAMVLSHPISCSFRQRKCIWEGHRISLCLRAARLKYKRLSSTHVSLLGGLSAVTDCQLRLWASRDDCLEMLSA